MTFSEFFLAMFLANLLGYAVVTVWNGVLRFRAARRTRKAMEELRELAAKIANMELPAATNRPVDPTPVKNAPMGRAN